jgi:putative drug exporter of the RND superfamily
MPNPFAALAAVSVGKRTRWVVIGLWIALAVGLSFAAPQLASLYDQSATSSIGNQESVRAGKLLQAAFPGGSKNAVPAIIVFSDPNGLTTQDYQRIDTVTCWLLSAAQRATYHCAADAQAVTRPADIGSVVAPLTLPQARSQLLSSDGATLTVIATINAPTNDPTTIVEQVRAYTHQFDGVDGLRVKVTGPAGIATDLTGVFANINVTILVTTVLLVLVLLLVIYRSPLLALLPLVAVGLALQVVDPITALFVQAGAFSVNPQATGVRDVLLFGAGTDYVIFLIARYREELEGDWDRFAALRRASVAVSEAITSSAGTVILALLTLLLTSIGFYNSLGPILAIAVAVMVTAGLTLVPALLSVLGRPAFWPSKIRQRPAGQAGTDGIDGERPATQRGLWGRIAAVVTARPAITLMGSLALLVVFAFGNLGVVEDYNFLTGVRGPTESAAGSKLLAQHFPAGTLAPSSVVIHLTQGGDAYHQLVAIDAITAAVAGAQNVAHVTGPTRPDGATPVLAPQALQDGFAQLPDSLKQAIRSGDASAFTGGQPGQGGPGGPPALDPRLISLYAATIPYISADGQTVKLTLTLKNDPYSAAALDAMAGVRRAATEAAVSAGLGPTVATVHLAGVTPTLADTRAVNDRDKALVIPLVLVLVAIVLGLLLRSLIAPLYLLASVTLNYFAALGLSSFFFTRIQGDEGLGYTVPLYTFIFLVALGADYTIFLMSRVREEAAQHTIHQGVQIALSRTGGVITSAGLILAGTFAVLATLPLRDLYQLGVTVAVGILLDTFVVRGFLVPAIVVLLGKGNWWPGGLTREDSNRAPQS